MMAEKYRHKLFPKPGLRHNSRPPLTPLVIFPSGKTEYHYFHNLCHKAHNPHIQIYSVKVKTPERQLRKLKKKALQQLEAFQRVQIIDKTFQFEVWIVIDRDYNTPSSDQLFYDTKRDCEVAGIRVAYSDDAFELWFLLHYRDVNNYLSAKDLEKELRQYCPQYRKPAANMYSSLSSTTGDSTAQAIRRATSLLKKAESQNVTNPSTTVHLLVQKILKQRMKKPNQ